ncbi:hypothetical protein K469DRAFT_689218 [Zopfia rhizophila CBS 207.26]|uniref:Heavy metal tolerance protein n=1 Tax=Zopfia rhizophila CBS 207.26 TaxID=1314779 RepID=A0A6A6ESK7_9PEZI|nr:hypothetical protein K469DRAFT_689218 [Zopfia rhizophila CBS 207.26]
MGLTMGHPPDGGTKSTALSMLDYMHAPTVAFYYLGALAFGASILQKSSPLTFKRRRISVSFMSIIILSYFAQLLYYLNRTLADDDFSAPQHTVIHALGSLLVWVPLTFSLLKSKAVLWHPYFGSFAVEFLFETTLCILGGVSLSTNDRFGNIPLSLSSLRAIISLGLVIDGFLIFRRNRDEKHTDEEGQSLLGKPVNGSAITPNGDTGYGAINQEPDEDSDSDSDDRDKEIKEQQRKRLEEQGGWLGYLKGFAVFLPYLWPKDDWRIMTCLAVRALYVIQGRFLNVLTPRQIGIITDKLTSGSGVMPWKDIAIWTFYSWFGSSSGFGMADDWASILVQNYSYKRITDLAFNHVMNLSMDFHVNKDSGEVIKSVDQAESLNGLIELVLFDVCPIIIDLFVAIWYVTHLFDAYMAFIVLTLGITYVSSGVSLTKWSQAKRRVFVEKARDENKTVYESVSNWQTVSYFNRNLFERDRYKDAVQTKITAEYGYRFRAWTGYAIQGLLIILGFAGACTLAISQIVSGKKPVGNLVTLMMYWEHMMSPLYTMAWSYRHIASTLIDAERLLQLLNTKPSVADADHPQDLAINSCKVEFKDVEFAYDKQKPILKGVSFIAEPGKTIAFVGETGGGKSTMLKLLFRFYDVTGGSIMIDGQDLRSVTLSSLRETIGVVPQAPTLFNQSILENVRYARLDATQEDVEKACKAAAVHDKIMSFADGYKSKVGERGVKLSGGELQRVAIARVLLKNPKIVMLDEATSSVDLSTEAQIQEAFSRLSSGRTTFVVAHRLSTIVEADTILVVDHGEIIERGTHAELLAQGGKYSELWAKQIFGGSKAASKAGSKANSTHGDTNDKTPNLLIDITPPEDETTDSAKTTSRSDEDGAGASAERRKP